MRLRKGRGMKVGKRLGALHSSHLQVAAILAQERAGEHTFPGKLCPCAAGTDANLTHLCSRVRGTPQTPRQAACTELGGTYAHLLDAATRRWPPNNKYVRGYVHIVC